MTTKDKPKGLETEHDRLLLAWRKAKDEHDAKARGEAALQLVKIMGKDGPVPAELRVVEDRVLRLDSAAFEEGAADTACVGCGRLFRKGVNKCRVDVCNPCYKGEG
jgi:hypothetical protein